MISALLLVYKDDIKDFAIEEANQYLNKKVHISAIDLTFWKTFPNITLSFKDVLIHSRFDTLQTADTALYAKELDLKFNPLDFYKQQYNIQQIDITTAKINLKVLEDGRVNYDILKASKDTTKTPFQFKLNNIQFKNTQFSYNNEATQQLYTAFFDELKIRGSFSEKEFTLTANSDFLIKTIKSKAVSLVTNKKAHCKITVGMNIPQSIFQIQTAQLSINKIPLKVEGTISKDSLKFYIGAHNINLPRVANNFGFHQLEMVQKVKGTGQVDFNLHILGERGLETEPPTIEADFKVKHGSLEKSGFKLSKINLSGAYSNGGGKGKEMLTIPIVKFHTLNKNFDGKLLITDFKHPHIQGKANGIIDLEAIHQFFGPFGLQQLSGQVEMKGNFDFRMNQPEFNKNNLTIYNMDASFFLKNIKTQFKEDNRIIQIKEGKLTIKNQEADFNHLLVKIGKSDLKLTGKFHHIIDYFNGGQNLRVDAQLTSKYLNIDDLTNYKSRKSGHRFWLLPDRITGKIALNLNKIIYQMHQYTDVKSNLQFKPHQLLFTELTGVNSNANIIGKLILKETKPMVLQINTTLKSNNVFFSPLFKEWNNFQQEMIKAENVKGKAKVDLHLIGPFDLFEQKILKNQFKVKVYLSIEDGQLRNVQAFKAMIKNLRSSAARLLISKEQTDVFGERLLNLKFERMENEFTIQNGVITIPKMQIRSNALNVNVMGAHTFTNKIDYHFDFRFNDLKENKTSSYGDIVDDKSGFRVFLHLFGTVEKPKFSWDKAASEVAAQQKRKDAKNDFKSALKKGFGIGKKDSSISTLSTKTTQREDRVIMGFEKQPEHAPKKEKKGLEQKIFQWKKEKQRDEKEQEPSFTIEPTN